jgi:DNA-binding HxlR family transcriptional regulator
MSRDPDMHEVMTRAVSLVSGKWKIAILSNLSGGPIRYNKLHRSLAPISTKVLTQRLRELEEDALVIRTPLAASPKTFGYEFTNLGLRLWRWLGLLGDLSKTLRLEDCSQQLSHPIVSDTENSDRAPVRKDPSQEASAEGGRPYFKLHLRDNENA